MTDRLPDVWITRDYPVLREAVRLIDNGDIAEADLLVDATGLSAELVGLAAKALERRGLVSGEHSFGGFLAITNVSGEAYLLTGLHPDGDDAVSQFASALRQAADHEADPEEKSRLRQLADGLGGVSRDVLSGVLTTVITAAGRGLIS